MSRLISAMAALCLTPALALAQMASAPFEGRLKKIHDTKTISVAYRTDAVPFSFEDKDKKPTGYVVELCRSVIGVIERQIGVTPLQVKQQMAGYGRATKKQVIEMVMRMMNITRKIDPDDAADALAIGLTAIYHVEHRSLFEREK